MKTFIVATLVLAMTTACLPYSYQAGGTLTDTEARVRVDIQPDLGWKWNKAYPSRFKIKFKDGTATAKYKFTDGRIEMGILYSVPAPTSVVVVASFSLCTKTVCRSFRNREFKISYL